MGTRVRNHPRTRARVEAAAGGRPRRGKERGQTGGRIVVGVRQVPVLIGFPALGRVRVPGNHESMGYPRELIPSERLCPRPGFSCPFGHSSSLRIHGETGRARGAEGERGWLVTARREHQAADTRVHALMKVEADSRCTLLRRTERADRCRG